MSWSERTPASPMRRRGAVMLLLCGAALALGGCGFQPLYARPDNTANGPIQDMASVRVAPLPDRTGQILHNMLSDRLNPGGPPAEPVYELDVELKESIEEVAIRRDETATRANLKLSAEYALRRRGTNEVVLKGQSLTTTTYNILSSQFATYTSEEDARKRALRELSDDIRIQLGAYFNRLNGSTS